MLYIKTALNTLFFFFVVSGNLLAEQLRYREITNDEHIIHDINITEEDNFKTIKTTGTKLDTQVITSNITFRNKTGIVKWEYTNTLMSFTFVATHEEDRIVISGTVRNKKIHKTFEIDKRPWFQIFPDIPYGLDAFVMSKDDKVEFWTLSIKPLNCFLAKAKREGNQKITVSGSRMEADKVKIAPSGMGSLFWKEYYFFLKENGHFVYVNGNIRTKKYTSSIELIQNRSENFPQRGPTKGKLSKRAL